MVRQPLPCSILRECRSGDDAALCSAYYWASVAEFLSIHPDAILGQLAVAHTLAPLEVEQTRAWAEEIEILGASLIGFQGTVYLEFDVPRLGSRIDAVLVSGPAVFPIEFKCGEQKFSQEAYNQAWDYALDLKNFHLASHNAPILPVLVATAASTTDERWQSPHARRRQAAAPHQAGRFATGAQRGTRTCQWP